MRSGATGPVDSMLESLRVDTWGLHLTSAPPTVNMFLTYKKKLKCRAILDARKVNSNDPRKPPKFRLPVLEGIRRCKGDARRNRGGGSSVSGGIRSAECVLEHHTPLVEKDICGRGRLGKEVPLCTSALWLEVQPSYLPAPRDCGGPSGALREGDPGVVYLDDILLSARRKGRLRRALRECTVLLQRAGFIVGAKSKVTPTESIGFVGNSIDTRAGTISNAVGALGGAFRAWVRGMGHGRLPKCAMERLLGKLCWLGRPNAGLGAFLAGAYTALQRGLGRRLGRGVVKGVVTILPFSCVPHAADPLGSYEDTPWEVFTDTAPESAGFRVGIVGEKGFYRSMRCPPWISSLQQAELIAVHVVAKLATYRGYARF